MRMNNMSGTMLRIGDHLLISHPDFSMVYSTEEEFGCGFESRRILQAIYVREAKLPGKQTAKNL